MTRGQRAPCRLLLLPTILCPRSIFLRMRWHRGLKITVIAALPWDAPSHLAQTDPGRCARASPRVRRRSARWMPSWLSVSRETRNPAAQKSRHPPSRQIQHGWVLHASYRVRQPTMQPPGAQRAAAMIQIGKPVSSSKRTQTLRVPRPREALAARASMLTILGGENHHRASSVSPHRSLTNRLTSVMPAKPPPPGQMAVTMMLPLPRRVLHSLPLRRLLLSPPSPSRSEPAARPRASQRTHYLGTATRSRTRM